jgi:hypothetical protein
VSQEIESTTTAEEEGSWPVYGDFIDEGGANDVKSYETTVSRMMLHSRRLQELLRNAGHSISEAWCALVSHP